MVKRKIHAYIYIIYVVVSGERAKKRFTRLRRLYARARGRPIMNAATVGSAVIFALNIYAKEVINFFFFHFSFLVFLMPL